ncbi:gamma-tubulin complex component 3 [Tribolium castaneum]|uniref:Gamma-tubulin complex component 3 homolog-like Protein n=1 Tax=Tribolium castaneum TaxID=7070 RepID=D6WM36_TRICA|nr:PREDICTED: gamma-tubulin complex component 3 [Tribolium castaneum]EFA04217.1 Gamma-tubulin complex component 3 homolog-like Protein [Tribolium castaneum]|eukprot:XP_975052.1 PREDICTED: gamma-tubulin complex component 3 [Tribolium castaneum]
MNSSTSIDTSNQPDLIMQLCNHFTKNKPGLSTNLCKTAFSFLSSPAQIECSVPSDEQFVVVQIREMLREQSNSCEQFELLYSNMCKTNVLENRASVLHFLLKLAKMSQKEVRWGTIESLDRFPSTTLTRPKSHYFLKSGGSQESIRSIFQGHSTLKSVQSSSTNIPSSRVTTAVSSVWSKNELESVSSPLPSETNLVSDRELLQDIIYSFHGIEGRFLRKEVGGLGFTLDPKAGKNITPIQRGLMERLTGMSFLHNQLKQYCDSNDEQGGVICLALIATLRDELSSYYRTIALLQTALRKHPHDQPQMNLHKALVYIHEHRMRFEWLAYIAEQCNEKKGGALITAVHGFLQHGSKCAQEVSEKVLAAVCKPLFIMLSRWLLDGEINDACNEFFIEARDIAAAERLWHDKYHVRKAMVPSFITMEQAKKILATGKSINFLRQICKDSGQLPERDVLQKLSKTTSESLFSPEQSLEFDSALEKVYRETSLRVLDLLKNKYRLYEHLQSLRRYLLLGQGDFIRHLLELLVPELDKPAQEIYSHTLSTILESAIRVTNAQFEDEDTLQRLNVSFMGHSQGDTGWDVFSLVYIVDGPVGTIFQPTMTTYQCLFGALWKAKRMEFVLANMRKQQISMAKIFRKIKELKPVMHIIHILTSEMIHFLHQTQYYFLFEVLECSWAEMLRRVNQAECLDEIITAHTIFLNSVQCGVLLDDSSRQLFSQLRSIYNFILTLEGYQKALNEAATREFEAFMALKAKTEKSDMFGMTSEDEIIAKARVENFHQFLSSIRTKVRHLAQTYEQFVKKYLLLLSSSSNMNLQLLSVRLSFNDYYKII